jgi:hypothetical protein
MEDNHDRPEIVFNFWFVADGGYIHALFGRTYIAYGSDEEKTKFLLKAALTDCRTAEEFPIPERFLTVRIGSDGSSDRSAVRADTLFFLGGIPALFDDLYEQLMRLPPASTSGLSLNKHPLKVITALVSDADGVLRPQPDNNPRILI